MFTHKILFLSLTGKQKHIFNYTNKTLKSLAGTAIAKFLTKP